MDLKETLKLIDAGFTAEEIRKLEPAQPAGPTGKVETTAEAKKKDEPKEEPKPEIIKPEPKEEPAPAYDEIIAGLNKKIDELTGAVSKISKISLFPAMDNIKPLGIDDVVYRFFKEE